MAAEAQLLLDLFDSCWFDLQILKKTQSPLPQIPKNEESIAETTQILDLSAIPTINVRSYSDELLTNSQNFIMNLQTPKLKVEEHEEKVVNLPVMEKKRDGRRRRNLVRTKSKSLSELEFEELKGFMDLGFLFSEKDKDSNLVSIIPGLQRLGKDEQEEDGYGNLVSRPYLSEAWGDLEKMKKEASRVIRIPALGNESDMKHQLRFWAHSVASVVR